VLGGLGPDETQFDPASPYYDAKSTRSQPRWIKVDVQLVCKTPLLSLPQMRAAPDLASMQVLQRGNRLSITPVTAAEWQAVLRHLGG
jgi:predicted RNA-binding protein with PUA-like domain